MTTNTPSTASTPHWKDDLPLLAVVALVAVLGRLPAFGAWWALDDWGLLARAAGLDGPASGPQARWLSQHLWWTLTWPLFGLNADAHTVTRLVLHAMSALLLVRLGARLGLGRGGRLVAGLLFTASPLVFTNVYWAAGIQELLGLTCALAGLELWLAGGRGGPRLARLAAVVLVSASLASKETALGLPILLALLLLVRERRSAAPADWMLVLFLALAAFMEGALVMRHFATSPGDPYATGGALTALRNLGIHGWWLLSPGPILTHHVRPSMLMAGLGLFVLWGAWAVFAWRRHDRRPALLFLASLLAVGPTLPLHQFLKPYLTTPALAVACLAVGLLVPRRWSPPLVVIVVLALMATTWSIYGMRVRLGNRDEIGFPADPVVRATSLSWQTSRQIEQLPWLADGDSLHHLVLLQIPIVEESREDAERMGELWVSQTELYKALGGVRGPALVAGPGVQVTWANALTAAPADAYVLCEEGAGFKFWGPLPRATFYAALTDVGLGAFSRARQHLTRGAAENPETVAFVWDEGLMIIPLEMVLAQKEAFVDWTVGRLADRTSSGMEVGGLQDLFLNLLESATGLSREQLTAGGRYVAGPAAAKADSATTGP